MINFIDMKKYHYNQSTTEGIIDKCSLKGVSIGSVTCTECDHCKGYSDREMWVECVGIDKMIDSPDLNERQKKLFEKPKRIEIDIGQEFVCDGTIFKVTKTSGGQRTVVIVS